MVAKYGIIVILDQSYDVCEIVKEVDKQCPIYAGVYVYVLRVMCVLYVYVCVLCVMCGVCVCVHACMCAHVCILVCVCVSLWLRSVHGFMCMND